MSMDTQNVLKRVINNQVEQSLTIAGINKEYIPMIKLIV